MKKIICWTFVPFDKENVQNNSILRDVWQPSYSTIVYHIITTLYSLGWVGKIWSLYLDWNHIRCPSYTTLTIGNDQIFHLSQMIPGLLQCHLCLSHNKIVTSYGHGNCEDDISILQQKIKVEMDVITKSNALLRGFIALWYLIKYVSFWEKG